MMNEIPEAALVAATVGNGLLAGVFFAFSSGVVPGLRRVDDLSYVTVFRAINRSIVNGLFILVFLGAPIATVAATALHLDAARRETLAWLVAGLALSLLLRGDCPRQRAAQQPSRHCSSRRRAVAEGSRAFRDAMEPVEPRANRHQHCRAQRPHAVEST